MRNRELLNPRFGIRRNSGVCPPSRSPVPWSACCPIPLCPRPEVLPIPEPMPRPTRLRSLFFWPLDVTSVIIMVESLPRALPRAPSGDRHLAQPGNVVLGTQHREGLEGRLDQVLGPGRAVDLGQYVFD